MAFIISLLFCIAPVVTSPNTTDINISEAVPIGGINQWISIKGTNRDNPVVLFLHGGPGNSVMGYAEKFTGELQQHFVVVQWDQRESGTTKKLNRSETPLTVTQMENDAVEMINYLRNRFSKEKVLLMGHSWGGFLGLLVAAEHPELLSGYVAISPMVYQVESERLSREWMIKKAITDGRPKAVEELNSISIPFVSGRDLYYHRSWLAELSGQKFPSRRFVEAWAEKWLPLFNEASLVNFFEVAPTIKCPIYFFAGKLDFQTHAQLTWKYYSELVSTRKKWYWFEDTGHSIPSQSPQRLQDIVINEIIPDLKN
jgi:pimeloyl-ACP methyl ester carboxylesterase